MSVLVVVGNIGSGKTLFMTCFGTLAYFSDYTIYANYKLTKIPFINMNNISSFDDIHTPNNMMLLDELWLTADSRRSMSFLGGFMSRKVLQSRKTGESSHVMITTQSFDQLDKRIRSIASIIFEPSILARDEFGKPLALKVEYFRCDENKKKIKKFNMPTTINGIDIPNSYDTFEIVDEFTNDNMIKRVKELIDKYLQTPIHKKTRLSSYIRFKEAELNNYVSIQESNMVADNILNILDMQETAKTSI